MHYALSPPGGRSVNGIVFRKNVWFWRLDLFENIMILVLVMFTVRACDFENCVGDEVI